ncbi:MAG: replicative DNA helicase [Bacilli bacterium]
MTKIKLPANLNAEKTVLGSMFLNIEALAVGLGSLTEDEFFSPAHKSIFTAIKNLQGRSQPVDLQTVFQELTNMKEIEAIGGLDYLDEVASSSIGYTNLDFYIKILQDNSVLRQLLLTMEEINDDYQKSEIDDLSEFVAIAGDKVNRVTEKRRISDFRSAADISGVVTKTMETLKLSGDGKVTGVPTGYSRINELTHGFQRGSMVIIAARPSVGKTAFALNLAFNAALKTNKAIGIFSIEMPAEQLIMRLIACHSTVQLDKIQINRLNRDEQKKVAEAISNIAALPLYIDDTPGIRLLDLVAKSKKLKAAHEDLSMIVIDYIGLITSGNKKVESRQLEVSEISRTLKELARELKIPVVVVSQLSREVDKRTNKRPVLSDLRESGSIEQDADLVMLLYRGDYQNDPSKDTKEVDRKSAPVNPMDPSEVEVNIAKNRNGPTGIATLLFSKAIGRFDTLLYEKPLTSSAAIEDD